MKFILAMLAATILSGSAGAQELQLLPKTPDENWAMGQRFANCSARFVQMAHIAKKMNLPDTVVLAEGKARGWKVVGMMFLVQGIDPARQTETERVFDNLVQIKFEDLKSRYELNPAALTAATPGELAAECQPLVPMQEKLIELLRRNAN